MSRHKAYICALKTQFYPLVFLSLGAGLRESAPQSMAEAWGVSFVPTGVCVSPIFSIGTFQLKPRPALHHMLPPQYPSGSESDTLLPGCAHCRLQSLTYPRPLGSGSDSLQEAPHCPGEMGSVMSVGN